MRTSRTLTFLGILTGLCFAGAPSILPAREVRFLAWDSRVAQRELAILEGTRLTAITRLHPYQRSTPFRLPATASGEAQSLQIVDPATLAATAEPDAEIPALLVEIPASIQAPLVLLIPSPNEAIGLYARVFEDSIDHFDYGNFRIINTTGKTLWFISREMRTEIPGSWEPVDISFNGGSNEAVVIALQDAERGIQPIYSSVWMPDADSRRLILIVQAEDQRLGAIDLKVIPEIARSR